MPLPSYLSYLMYQTEQHRRAMAADHVARHGLSFPKWVAMLSLARFGECSMTRLAKLSAADRTTLTRSIDGLIRDGLVERGGAPNDRRKVVVRLTPTGAALLQTIRDELAPLHQEACSELSADEQSALAFYLKKMLGGLIPEPDWKDEILSFGPPLPSGAGPAAFAVATSG
ncbi:MarR family winged helix-turn-helix transcriptional regulator [Caulobacter hibisci]|nr:MarR family transcriptional regulator [Caulobacter hibisci]